MLHELNLNELKQVNGGDGVGVGILSSMIWDAAKAMWVHFKQDNGGPSATWENNGGYIG